MLVSRYEILSPIFKATIVIFTILHIVSSKTTARLYFGPFYAPGSVRCDLFSSCNFRFKICVDKPGSGSGMSPCAYLSTITSPMGRSPINLARISPMSFTVHRWEGGFNLKVQVLDYDRFSKDDVIDNLIALHRGSINSPATYKMTKRTSLAVTVTTSCALNYYGSHCATFCDDKDTDQYRCNPVVGTKICLPDWTGYDCQHRLQTTTTSTVADTTAPEVHHRSSISSSISISGTSTNNESGSTLNAFRQPESTTPESIYISSGDELNTTTTGTSVVDLSSVRVPYDSSENTMDYDTVTDHRMIDPFNQTVETPPVLQWFCGRSLLTSSENFNRSSAADDAVSTIIATLLNDFAEYPNSTLNFEYAQQSETCNRTHAIRLEYCLLFDLERTNPDLESLVATAYDRSSAATAAVDLLQGECEDVGLRQHHRSAEPETTDDTDALIFGLMVSLLIVLLALGAAVYIWTRREKRKAAKAFTNGSLSYASPVYCMNDDPATAIISGDAGVYSMIDDSASSPFGQNGDLRTGHSQRVENEYVVI